VQHPLFIRPDLPSTPLRYAIARDIMNKKTLKRLRKELEELRRNFAPQSHATLAEYASAVGRKIENRGKEPTWIKKTDPSLSPPLSIPNHSKDIKAGTARSIIDQLLADLDEWDMYLTTQEDKDED